MLDLWKGVAREVREHFPMEPTPSDPYVVAAAIDTRYLNRIDHGGLPATLRRELDELQKQAAEDEEEVDTRWVYDGVPLRMYRAGVNTDQGGGVSWSYILRNNSLALLNRKAPLGGIVAQALLGSVCLWRLTLPRALDEVDTLVKRMWASPIPFPRERKLDTALWQVSQVHMVVDVANAPLEVEQAARYVSRSRTQAVFEAARSEMEKLMWEIHGPEAGDIDTLVLDWNALYEDDGYDAFDPFDDLIPDRDRDVEPVPVEHRAATTFRSGARISGMTFSPCGDVSMVLYDSPCWRGSRASGTWSRSGLRRAGRMASPSRGTRRSCVGPRCTSWDCPTTYVHAWTTLGDSWNTRTMSSLQSSAAPNRARTRSMWPGSAGWCPRHPIHDARAGRPIRSGGSSSRPPSRKLPWRRGASSGASSAAMTQRCSIAGQYGYLASRTAILHLNGGQWTFSRALGEALPQLEAVERAQGIDFGELVRERRRQRGLPLPIAEKVLPFRPQMRDASMPITEDAANSDSNESQGHVELLNIHSEARMAEAWDRLAAAELAGSPPRELESLEAAYQVELSAYHAALARESA